MRDADGDDDRDDQRTRPCAPPRRVEATTRPSGQVHDRLGRREAGSSSGARNSPTRWPTRARRARWACGAALGAPAATGAPGAAADGRLRRRRAGIAAGVGAGPLGAAPDARRSMSPRRPVGRGRPEVGELHVAPLPGDAILELRGAEQPGEERPDDVDALDAVEPRAAVRAEQDAAAHLDGLVGDAEGVHAPRQPEPDDEQHEQHGDRDERPADEPVRDDGVDRVARPVAAAARPAKPSSQLGANEQQEQSTSRSRRFAMMKPRIARSARPPRSSGVAGCSRCHSPSARLVPRDRTGRCAHSPARRLSASATSWSRSRSASSTAGPGSVTAVAAAAVTNLSSASPSARATGPRLMSTSCIRP